MANLTLCGNDDGDLKCSECDAIFAVIWHRSAIITGICFCPFCGEEVEEVEAKP